MDSKQLGRRYSAALLSASWLTLLMGCGPQVSGDYVKNISAADPEIATAAMNQASEKKAQRALVPLVKRLYDEDSAVRLAAISALKSITDQDMGYRSYEPEAKRIQAIQRWEDWLKAQNLVEQDTPIME